MSVGEAPRPKASKDCVLVRVMAVSIHPGDDHMLTGRPYLIRAAVGHRDIPGMDFAGVVEELGSGVEGFAPGDEVLGTTDTACGAFAEYVSIPSQYIVKKPGNIAWETAASIATSGQTALQAMRLGRVVTKDSRVLINGASGGVGSIAVQLAKQMGAHVTGVCSTNNVELVRSLGADVVVDYKVGTVETASAGRKYDKILDMAGRPGCRKLLTPTGDYVAVALPYPESECVPCALFTVLCSPCCCCCLSSKKSHAFMQSVEASDLQELTTMVSEGKLRVVVGTRLEGLEALPDAYAGHGTARVAGKTVVEMHRE